MTAKRPKTKVISCRVPIELHEAIEKAAVTAGTSASAYVATTVERSIAGKEPSARPPSRAPDTKDKPAPRAAGISLSDPAAFAELKRIGINVNQIAHAINAGLPQNAQQIVAAFKDLFEVLEQPDAFKTRLAGLAQFLAKPIMPSDRPTAPLPLLPRVSVPKPTVALPPMPPPEADQWQPEPSPVGPSWVAPPARPAAVNASLPQIQQWPAQPQPPARIPPPMPRPQPIPPADRPRATAPSPLPLQFAPMPPLVPPPYPQPMPPVTKDKSGDPPHPSTRHKLQGRHYLHLARPPKPTAGPSATDRRPRGLGLLGKLWNW